MSPSVCCVCLTADRQAFTDRAVRCFNAQTYGGAVLMIYDTGAVPYDSSAFDREALRRVVVVRDEGARGKLIGALRNLANGLTRDDVLVHWDSDDWSNPNRIAEQMEVLKTGWDATGYRDLLLYDSRKKQAWSYCYASRNQAHGTSLAYWRETWAHNPFAENKREGEEKLWPHATGLVAMNGIDPGPMMIAEYHGGNTGNYGRSDTTGPVFDWTPGQLAASPQAFKRAPEWDQHCEETLYP